MKSSQTNTGNQVSVEAIDQAIVVLRGYRVMLDSVLSELYGVETKALNRAVLRNLDRFPADFMFQLTTEEFEKLKYNPAFFQLRFQIGTSKRGGRRYLPYAFTQEGVAMLSSVLRSPRAAQVNIEIMRAFVRLRQILGSNVELARKLNALEKRYDSQFKTVFTAIRELMSPKSESKKPKIGFRTKKA